MPQRSADVDSNPARTLAAAIALVIYYIVLLVSADATGDGNVRHNVLLNLGSRAVERSGKTVENGSELTLDGSERPASATWDDYSYQIGHLLARSRSCEMSVAIVGTGLTSPDRRGTAEALVNGEVVERIVFSNARRGLYPLAGDRLVPANVIPQRIELVPLDDRYGFVIPIPQRFCSARQLTVGVRTSGTTWTVSHAGVLLAYTPAAFPPAEATTLAIVGALLVVASIALLYLVLSRFARLGTATLATATTVLALAPLAYDQWDFRIWMGFGETAVFGAGDPAYLWYGSPLWTFVPALFSTMTAAAFVTTGHGAESMTAVFMKVAMGLAYCYTAYAIAVRAPSRLRATYAIVALLLPVGLYELAAGYREIFATALAIASLHAARGRRYILSTTLAVVAASISEELLPLTMLPAALASTEKIGVRRRAVDGAGLAILAIVLFLAQWSVLLPHDFAENAFRYRFGQAPLGGASWGGSLNALGLLPSWLPVRSPMFDALLFLALAALPAARLVPMIVASQRDPRPAVFEDVVGIFTAFVAAFLLAFRGTDPNLWYALTAIAMWYFASAHPRNPFPLVLASLEGLAFYATVGFREFVNHSFFWPVDAGLLGTLSTSRYVFDLMASALMLAFIAGISMRNVRAFFSENTPFVSALFVMAVASTSTDFLALDLVVVAAASILLLLSISRSVRYDRHLRTEPASYSRATGLLLMAGIGAYAGMRSGLAGFCATALCLCAARVRLGSCDIVLGLGTIAVLGSQTGSGIVSTIGCAALVVALLATISNVFAGPSRSTAQARGQ